MSAATNCQTSVSSPILSSLIAYGPLGIAIFLLFEKARHWKLIYQPRNLSNKVDKLPVDLGGLFQWIPVTLQISDEETLQIVGYDAFIFLKFIRILIKMSAICTFFGFVGIRDDRLWAPCVFVWLYTLLFLYFLHIEYRNFAILRQQYFRNPGEIFPIQTTYSCMIENLPPNVQTNDELNRIFSHIFPGEIHSVYITRDLTHIEKLLAERQKYIGLYENAVAIYEGSNHTNVPSIRVNSDAEPMCLPFIQFSEQDNQPIILTGTIIPVIPYYRKKIKTLTGKIEDALWESRNAHNVTDHNSHDNTSASSSTKARNPIEEYMGFNPLVLLTDDSANKPSSTGFVTFNSVRAQTAASQTAVLYDTYPDMYATPACVPTDIVWKNVTWSQHHTYYAKNVLNVVLSLDSQVATCYTGVIFWFSIITFISSISNLETISKVIPISNNLTPFQYSIVNAIIPVLVLMIFLNLLPAIFGSLAHYILKLKSTSAVQAFACDWYFRYLLINIYLTVFTNSVIKIVSEAIVDPNSILQYLGIAIPQVSIFFTSVIIWELCLGIPLVMSRYGPLFSGLYYIFASKFCFNQSRLSIRSCFDGPLSKAYYNYGFFVPYFLYYVGIVLLFWVIAPIVIGFALAMFSFTYVNHKYQFLFIYRQQFQSGGQYFYRLYESTMIGLIASSICMLGMMAVKVGIPQTSCLIPLPIIVLLVWAYTERTYKSLSLNMAMNVAVSKGNFKADVESLVYWAPQEHETHNLTTKHKLSHLECTENELHVKDTKEHQNNADDQSLNHKLTTRLSLSIEDLVQFDTTLYEQPAYRLLLSPPVILPYRFDGAPLFDGMELDSAYYDATDLTAKELEKYQALEEPSLEVVITGEDGEGEPPAELTQSISSCRGLVKSGGEIGTNDANCGQAQEKRSSKDELVKRLLSAKAKRSERK